MRTTIKEFNKRTAIEKMRDMVKLFNNCNESFLDQFDFEDLPKIYLAFLASDWDILPDRWDERQVNDALRGFPPNWDANEKPVYLRPLTKV